MFLSFGRDKNGDVYDILYLWLFVGFYIVKMKVVKFMDSFLVEIVKDGNLLFFKF